MLLALSTIPASAQNPKIVTNTDFVTLVFTDSGTFTPPPKGAVLEYLIVGAGGGGGPVGGNTDSGGGNAGQVKYAKGVASGTTPLPVIVGAPGGFSSPGNPSSFMGVTANGGATGLGYYEGDGTGASGGKDGLYFSQFADVGGSPAGWFGGGGGSADYKQGFGHAGGLGGGGTGSGFGAAGTAGVTNTGGGGGGATSWYSLGQPGGSGIVIIRYTNNPTIDIQLFAGMNMTGQTGATYVLSYTTNLDSSTNWIPLATNTMPASGWLYIDTNTPFSTQRFYRIRLSPEE